MNIHEYQAKAFLARRGVAVPAGRVAATVQQAGLAYDELRLQRAVVKAQIHAGGRGKAGGILVAAGRAETEAAAGKLLGRTLVTAQTGPRGRPVDKVLVEECLQPERELYLGLSLDRGRGCPVALASARGGMDIEELGRSEPGAILREYADPEHGLALFQARNLFAALRLPHERMKAATELILTLAKAFIECDCSLIEVNPLALSSDGRLLAADLKMAFDDNALARHAELAELRDTAQEDPREVEAERYSLSYVGLEGSVGCMVNGAGLAMATMDLIRLQGGEPANFLDVGGDATVEKVTAAFRLISKDARVRAILVNIFGGIVRCDVVAEGIIAAAGRTGLRVPLVVRLEGTRAEEGRKMLSTCGLRIVPAASLEDAAAKAVALSQSPMGG